MAVINDNADRLQVSWLSLADNSRYCYRRDEFNLQCVILRWRTYRKRGIKNEPLPWLTPRSDDNFIVAFARCLVHPMTRCRQTAHTGGIADFSITGMTIGRW